MSSAFLSNRLKAEASRLGFCACGVARAEAVSQEAAARFDRWIAAGGHADMGYMERYREQRLNPALLVEGARSIVSVAMSYAPAVRLPADGYQMAAYALGRDYHDVFRERLTALAEVMGWEGAKVAVDAVPILERYWAQQAGIGFIGLNHQLIVPGHGSMCFLGEIITTAEADCYDEPLHRSCGQCGRCTKACPTGALGEEGFNARRCLSYQTIENRGPLSPEAAAALGDCFYGCDRCQQACPHNAQIPASTEPAFQPSAALLAMKKTDWHALTIEQYRALFKGSAVKRAKYEGLMRNLSHLTI